MLDDMRPTSPEMDRAERYLAGDPFARPAAEPERAPLDLATAFLADHQVVALLEAGADPLLTVSVLKLPSGECQVVATVHNEDSADTARAAEVGFAHAVLLDNLRRVIDHAYGQGEAVKRLFIMATDAAEADAAEASNEATRPLTRQPKAEAEPQP